MYVLTQIRDHDETITIYETNELYGEMGRFRVMAFHDDAVQGVLDLRDPARIVLEYPKAMLHLMNEWLLISAGLSSSLAKPIFISQKVTYSLVTVGPSLSISLRARWIIS